MKEDLSGRATPLAWVGAEAISAGLVLGYGALSNLVIPKEFYVPANLAAAGAAIYLCGRLGITREDMGLERSHMKRGLLLGLKCAAPIAIAIAIGVAIPWSRRYFLDSRVTGASTGEALYFIFIRIPIGTALAEELLFRGALLGLFLKRHRPWLAVALSSVLFGFWHVLPTLQSLDSNASIATTVGTGAAAKLGAVAGMVALTTVVGAGFSLMRLRSRSVVAPWVAHTALNSLSYLGGRIAARLGV